MLGNQTRLSRLKIKLFSTLNCFSGGVLLAAGFVHMFPDMLEDARRLHLDEPSPMIAAMVGLLIPFLIEKSALLHCVTGGRDLHDIFDHHPNVIEASTDDACDDKNGHTSSYGSMGHHKSKRHHENKVAASDKKHLADIKEAELTYIQVKDNGKNEESDKYRIPVRPGCCNRGDGVHFQLKARCINCKTVINSGNEPHPNKDCPTIMFPSQSLISIALQPVRGQKQDIVEDLLLRHQKGSKATISYLLLFILSVHSVSAGISFGANGKFGTALGLFLAIICHKIFAGFALGMSFRQNSIPFSKAWSAIVLFSSMTPLGAMLGFIAARLAPPVEAIFLTMVFKGIGAGTFIYISLVEILLEEFEGKDDKVSKLAGFMIGTTLMTILGYYI
eukprot:CAMPEP_0167747078 /NCGR_PEP_ID=MMETSP0110_2-20121227/4076_1 /TAXON_ID=629695 /ORGANISM="Gymnochlora sp., Strain CCMP2014" /LENGTH=388 /DNA_ID=CAMNT_0007631929 /DNA_START=104 /DNA_END=1270 /DNA_ORIENTATION=+